MLGVPSCMRYVSRMKMIRIGAAEAQQSLSAVLFCKVLQITDEFEQLIAG